MIFLGFGVLIGMHPPSLPVTPPLTSIISVIYPVEHKIWHRSPFSQ
jgi:hypothetical protein